MSETKSFRETLAQNTYVHVAFGFLAMGGWAVFANRDHTLPEMLLAGVVQGTISGLLTLGLKKFLEWFAAKLSGWAALIVPPLITAATILVILITAHTLAGTPEIALTIAVPFSVSTLYAIVYNWGLWRRADGR